MSVHQLAVAAPAQTMPLHLNDNPGSNKHRPRKLPTDAETTPSPSHSPLTNAMYYNLPGALYTPYLPLLTIHPVSGNQGLRLVPCPSPPRMAVHS